MTFTPQQIRENYKRLPPGIRDLILDSETIELIATALKESGLSEEQADLADSEILYAMYCLQSLDEAINNISKLSGKSVESLSKIRATVQDKILSQYKIDIKDFINSSKSLLKVENLQTPQVPEVAPEIHPVIKQGETAHSVPPIGSARPTPSVTAPSTPVKPVAPTPAQPETVTVITTETKKKEVNASVPDYRYPGGKDPYREPLV